MAVFFGWLLRLANSIYRLPPLLPPVCHVNLVVALEGEEEVVVDREGQKGCVVFRVAAVLCQIGAGGALELVGSSAVEAVGGSLDRESGRGVERYSCSGPLDGEVDAEADGEEWILLGVTRADASQTG